MLENKSITHKKNNNKMEKMALKKKDGEKNGRKENLSKTP